MSAARDQVTDRTRGGVIEAVVEHLVLAGGRGELEVKYSLNTTSTPRCSRAWLRHVRLRGVVTTLGASVGRRGWLSPTRLAYLLALSLLLGCPAEEVYLVNTRKFFGWTLPYPVEWNGSFP